MIILFAFSTVPDVYGQDRLFKTQVLKVNLLPLGVRSYNVGYETTWSDQWSVSIAFGLRPQNSFPFREDIEGYYSDQDIKMHQTKLYHLSVTPELRRYFSIVSGLRGFYVGMFLQYARFGYNGRIDYVGGAAANSSDFMFDGGINTLTAGASVGRQWRFGQAVYLDWQIFAPSFGLNKGLITGTRIGGNPLDHVGISVLENKPNEFNTPLVDVDVDARPDEVLLNTRGAWAGLRMWLSLGYRF
ncbi:DUF3575 domain-containing protein [Sphingobacterium chungjuense]|uniref:DUF3575 domain-containing protein n=1 Tax=Sphingobacterium chungjuense TaxID=2675553 RepID=UPI00140AE183|nr:DUF3575 domain-containing protein [Sphingobacterium chungjuense]